MRLPILALWICVPSHAAQAQAPVVEQSVDIPMRDGVVLRATVLRPAAEGRFPTLIYRTPYGKDRAVETYSLFHHAVERGYAVVAGDVRGRYTSDGELDPYRQEGRDGYDTIEWAAGQPWSTGRIGTVGLSYPGAVQWLAAVEGPPHLTAMAPAMTFSQPNNFWYSGGVFDLSWPGWIWLNIAPDVRERKGLSGPRNGADAAATWPAVRDLLVSRLPLRDFPELQDVAPWYFEWMRHPAGDPWWDWADLRNRYQRVSAAVLNLSGWHDEAYGPEGALTNHLGLLAARRGAPDPRSRLILGPWVHGIPGRTERSQRAGERVFGPEAGLDYDEEVLRFMDRYVREEPNGVEREPRVRVFVMGENRWLTGDTWPLPGTEPLALYLGAAPGEGPGWLVAKPAAGRLASSFVSDPARPVADPYAGSTGAHDYRDLATRADLLVFETAPLSEPLRVVGNITAEIYLSTDARDTDLWVRLFDVGPDGTAWSLMSPGLDVLRASYRDGGPERKLLQPGKVYRLVLGNLLTGNLFQRGHRVRVILTTAFVPHFSRNLHTGALETESAELRSARITIHHDAKNPSRVVLPLVRR